MYVILIGLAALISFLLIGPGEFPSVGIALSALLLTLLTAVLIKPKKGWGLFLCSSLCLLSLCMLIRSNPLVLFLDFVALGYLLALFARNKKPHFLLSDLILVPFWLFWDTLTTKNALTFPSVIFFKNRQLSTSNEKVVRTIFSVLTGVTILVVVSGLLSTANPIFNQWFKDVFDWLSSFDIFSLLSAYTVIRLLLFGVLVLLLPKYVSFLIKPDTQNHNPTADFQLPFSLDVAKVLVLLVLTVFFVSQFQLYTANTQHLADLGITLSEKTREVFFQLSLVSLIILSMLYVNFGTSKISRLLSSLLIIYGLGLTAIAFYSDVQYISSWGYTYKRLYGLVVVGWLTGLFGLTGFWQYRKKSNSWFLQGIIITSVISLLVINALNFDFLIYHVQKSSTSSGVDYEYLGSLSPDSLSYKEQVEAFYARESQNCEKIGLRDYHLFRSLSAVDTYYSNKANWRSYALLGFLTYQELQSTEYQKLVENYHSGDNPLCPPEFDSQTGIKFQEVEASSSAQAQSIQGQLITVTLSEIPPNQYNINYQILDESQQQVAIGGLTLNQFQHVFGPGTFTIRLYTFGGIGDDVKSSVVYQKTYTIPPKNSSDSSNDQLTL